MLRLQVTGACTDWTTKAENYRPNCLILKALTLKCEVQTDLAGNFWQAGSYQPLTVLAEQRCRRKAIHSVTFAVPHLSIVTMPEDSFCSATAVQEETYATWVYGKTQSQTRSRGLAV